MSRNWRGFYLSRRHSAICNRHACIRRQSCDLLVAVQVNSREGVWSGKDMAGRRLCFVTGRFHNPRETVGSGKAFQKVFQTIKCVCRVGFIFVSLWQFLVHVTEEGCLREEETGASVYHLCLRSMFSPLCLFSRSRRRCSNRKSGCCVRQVAYFKETYARL
jgi:hypothetical protein